MMKKVKARLAAAAVAVGLAVGGTLVAAAPASATDYGIDMNKVCAHFTNVGWSWAKPVDAGNPYTWQCSTLPYPGWYNWGGSLDLDLWCAYDVGGYVVLVSPYNAYSWRCRV